jgi:hypothetical protein
MLVTERVGGGLVAPWSAGVVSEGRPCSERLSNSIKIGFGG